MCNRIFSIEHTVSVDEALESQLINVSIEGDLLPLLLAYCNYSLQQGQGTQVQYDLQGLQTQVYQKFIRGRPRVITKVNSHFLLLFHTVMNHISLLDQWLRDGIKSLANRSCVYHSLYKSRLQFTPYLLMGLLLSEYLVLGLTLML